MNTPIPPPIPPGSRRAYWACQLVGWGTYASLQIGALIVVFHLPWKELVVELGSVYVAMLVISHLLHGYIRRNGWALLKLRARVPRVLLAGLIAGAVPGVALTFMGVGGPDISVTATSIATHEEVSSPGGAGISLPPPLTLPEQLSVNVMNSALLFCIWMTIYFTVVGARRRRYNELRQSEVARALQGAELRLLKSQLNPHFLFNSLNSVRALIADDPARAQTAVTQLAKTLRYTLTSHQDELVTLAHEMEIVDDYLAIEALRLGERLKIERDVSPDAARSRIPVMMLQTVVENAIKHGIAELPDGGALRISANLRDGLLVLDVENSRPTTPAQPSSEGIGLRNASERLRLLFGNTARLELDLSAPDRAATRIRIPAGT